MSERDFYAMVAGNPNITRDSEPHDFFVRANQEGPWIEAGASTRKRLPRQWQRRRANWCAAGARRWKNLAQRPVGVSVKSYSAPVSLPATHGLPPAST